MVSNISLRRKKPVLILGLGQRKYEISQEHFVPPEYVRAKQTTKRTNDTMSKGHRSQHEKASIRLSRNNLNK